MVSHKHSWNSAFNGAALLVHRVSPISYRSSAFTSNSHRSVATSTFFRKFSDSAAPITRNNFFLISKENFITTAKNQQQIDGPRTRRTSERSDFLFAEVASYRSEGAKNKLWQTTRGALSSRLAELSQQMTAFDSKRHVRGVSGHKTRRFSAASLVQCQISEESRYTEKVNKENNKLGKNEDYSSQTALDLVQLQFQKRLYKTFHQSLHRVSEMSRQS